MKRQLCATALFALALIPDWASACWPRGVGPAPEPAYYAPPYSGPAYSGAAYSAPVYSAPVYSAPAYARPIFRRPIFPIFARAQPVYVSPPPVVVIPAPYAEPMRPMSGSPMISSVQPIAQPNPASKPPQLEPVRPASGIEAPKPPTPAPRGDALPVAKPEPAPAPAPEPKRGGLIEIPKPAPEPKLPPLELPKDNDPKLPPIDVPTGPGAGPKLPPLELPKDNAPKPPSIEPPSAAPAVPSAAPAPDPLNPTPKNPSALPPLTLPPDTPVAPAPPVEVKSSPLTGAESELKVNVFPATGATSASGLRKVGFYNHTARDLSLTIEGKTVTLPAMSYLHAQLPSSFTWKCADKPATKETIPAGAVGVDVVIRE